MQMLMKGKYDKVKTILEMIQIKKIKIPLKTVTKFISINLTS